MRANFRSSSRSSSYGVVSDVGGSFGGVVAYLEVGDADGFGAAGVVDGLDFAPDALEFLGPAGFVAEVGLVEDVEVDVVYAEFLEAGVEAFLDVVDAVVELGDDEEVGAGDGGFGEGGADLGLGRVDFGTVDVVEADV